MKLISQHLVVVGANGQVREELSALGVPTWFCPFEAREPLKG